MNTYKVLDKNIYSSGEYSLVPIREQDRYDIMNWRNEQIYHLRQTEPLTTKSQDAYFENVVAKLFDQEQPNQLLFSYLKNDDCIGYGGLVHINWVDRNAEISFVMNTIYEKDSFELHWKIYLGLIEKVAFESMNFHKIFTYAFDLRPRLYSALRDTGFTKEARLREHCYFDGEYKDVLIHSKFVTKLSLKLAQPEDVDITFQWASDIYVRRYAISKDEIQYDSHREWFKGKLDDSNCLYYIAYYAGVKIGSFRLDVDENGQAVISYLLSSQFHGRGLGTKLLAEGIALANQEKGINTLVGKVFKENEISCRLFEKFGFDLESDQVDPLVYKKKQCL